MIGLISSIPSIPCFTDVISLPDFHRVKPMTTQSSWPLSFQHVLPLLAHFDGRLYASTEISLSLGVWI